MSQFRFNLLNSGKTLAFGTSRRKGEPAKQWRIKFPPETEAFNKFSRYKTANQKTYLPIVWETKFPGVYPYKDTAYWIIRCTKEIIKDHNDIRSQQAIDTYAALYAISLALRERKPDGTS